MNDEAFINYQLLSDKLRIPLTSVESSIKKLTFEIYEEVKKIVEENKETIEKIARILID